MNCLRPEDLPMAMSWRTGFALSRKSCAAVRWISERRKPSLPFVPRCLGSGRGTLRYELSLAASLSVASAKKRRSASKERPCNSERQANQIFFVLDLPAPVDPDNGNQACND